MRTHEHRRRAAGATNAFKYSVVTRDAKTETTEGHRDGHAKHAELKETLDHPRWDLLLLIDLNRGMFILEIDIKRGEQLIALRDFIRRGCRIGKREILAKVAPESVLDDSDGGRIRPQHFLCGFDLLAIFRADILEFGREVRVGSRCRHGGSRIKREAESLNKRNRRKNAATGSP